MRKLLSTFELFWNGHSAPSAGPAEVEMTESLIKPILRNQLQQLQGHQRTMKKEIIVLLIFAPSLIKYSNRPALIRINFQMITPMNPELRVRSRLIHIVGTESVRLIRWLSAGN